MNFIKRAMLAVIRKKGRTFILFIIFAAIANLVLAAFAIRHASDYASVLARQKLGGKLTLSYNMQAAMEKAAAENPGQRVRPQAEPVTEAMVKQIAAQKNILDYNYIVSSAALADGFKAVVTQEENNNAQSDQSGEGRMQKGFNFTGNANYTMPDVMVTGVASSDLLDAFSNGDAKLINGRAIDREKDLGKNVALIEKNLADLNSLKAGSKIKLKAISGNSTAEFTVIGIYEATSNTQDSGPRMGNMSFTDRYNRIYVD
jgi:putative ABC transport system permease protein